MSDPALIAVTNSEHHAYLAFRVSYENRTLHLKGYMGWTHKEVWNPDDKVQKAVQLAWTGNNSKLVWKEVDLRHFSPAPPYKKSQLALILGNELKGEICQVLRCGKKSGPAVLRTSQGNHSFPVVNLCLVAAFEEKNC